MCSKLALRSLVRYLVNEGPAEPSAELNRYARLVLLTETPRHRAAAYLSDTGGVGHATGRLLLRAGERHLRTAGEIDPRDFKDSEGELT